MTSPYKILDKLKLDFSSHLTSKEKALPSMWHCSEKYILAKRIKDSLDVSPKKHLILARLKVKSKCKNSLKGEVKNSIDQMPLTKLDICLNGQNNRDLC